MDNATPASKNRALVKQIFDSRKRSEREDKLKEKQDREVAAENKQRQSQFQVSHGLLIAFLVLILLVVNISA